MAKIFIDCGGNWKRIVDRYLKLAVFDKIYVFEPNPLFYDSYENSNYELIKKAVWIENTSMLFYISKDKNQVASSLFKDKLSKVDNKLLGNYWHESIEVECIDFSEWIENNFNSQDEITLKLDIEGAEYAVLNKLIDQKQIFKIKKLMVEFHLETIPSKKQEHDELMKKIQNLGINIEDWD